MKQITFLFCIFLIAASCKTDKKDSLDKLEGNKTLKVSKKIANAYGFENWKNVHHIDFTFNVNRDSIHFQRSWRWNPKTGDVTMTNEKKSISYNRKHVDSLTIDTDKAFINDKYWLLAPFQLLWDKGTTISDAKKEEAPISKISMHKITLTYPNNGGYTPGDAYDLYFNDDYIIKEWVYRKENNKKPSLTTTWENNQDFNGIKIGLNHLKAEGNWKLYFTNVKIENK